MSTDTPPPAPLQVHPGEPVRVIIEQRNTFWRRWGSRIGWILFAFTLISFMGLRGSYEKYAQSNQRIEEKHFSHNMDSNDKVAIITVEGMILTGDGFVKSQIDQAKHDPNVKAVVLRINSPGGTINGSDFIYHQLRELTEQKKIPIVVSMGGLAASGGYWVAMATQGSNSDVIFAEPSTWTGSIGVIIPHYDVTELLEKWNVKNDSIVSHPLKEMLSMTKKVPPELREEERKILQELVDDGFGSFKEIVKKGRPKMSQEQIEKIATGQIFTAKQALQNGLVDQIGFLDNAVDRAIELAKLNSKNVRAVRYTHPSGLFDVFTSNVESPANSGNGHLSALLDLTTPRAYALFTALPSLVTSGN